MSKNYKYPLLFVIVSLLGFALFSLIPTDKNAPVTFTMEQNPELTINLETPIEVKPETTEITQTEETTQQLEEPAPVKKIASEETPNVKPNIEEPAKTTATDIAPTPDHTTSLAQGRKIITENAMPPEPKPTPIPKPSYSLIGAGDLYDAIIESPAIEAPSGLSTEDIVAACTHKDQGNDHKTTMNVILENKFGEVDQFQYIKLWKHTKDSNNVYSKTLLFSTFPQNTKGVSFLRWNYINKDESQTDQWLYLPTLGRVTQIKIRDLGDFFLGSDLNYSDIIERTVDKDTQTLVKAAQLKDGRQGFIIESKPREETPLYSKRVYAFAKAGDWPTCVEGSVHYYDLQGDLLKRKTLEWEQFGSAWLWKRMTMTNIQTNHKTRFEFENTTVNSGLEDALFTKAGMEEGLAWLEGEKGDVALASE